MVPHHWFLTSSTYGVYEHRSKGGGREEGPRGRIQTHRVFYGAPWAHKKCLNRKQTPMLPVEGCHISGGGATDPPALTPIEKWVEQPGKLGPRRGFPSDS